MEEWQLRVSNWVLGGPGVPVLTASESERGHPPAASEQKPAEESRGLES